MAGPKRFELFFAGAFLAAAFGVDFLAVAFLAGAFLAEAFLAVAMSRALSMVARDNPKSVKGRKVAVLAMDGVDAVALQALRSALGSAGAKTRLLSSHLGQIQGADGQPVPVDDLIVTMPSVVFDAVIVAPGVGSATALKGSGDALQFVREAYKHNKAMGAFGSSAELLVAAGLLPPGASTSLPGVTVAGDAAALARGFLADLARHRIWDRDTKAVAA